MAEAVVVVDVRSHSFSQDICDSKVFACVNCMNVKNEIQNVKLKLSSTQLIIKILQEENNPTKASVYARTCSSSSNYADQKASVTTTYNNTWIPVIINRARTFNICS